MIVRFVEDIIRVRYPTATGVVADPEIANAASIRAFEKAGFGRGRIVDGEFGDEQLMVLRF